MTNPLPRIVDLMPREAREPSAAPPYSVHFLIALSLCMIPYRWAGRPLRENSYPVRTVVNVLRWGGYKIVPMEREDYESRNH